jgi:hypothetical protein
MVSTETIAVAILGTVGTIWMVRTGRKDGKSWLDCLALGVAMGCGVVTFLLMTNYLSGLMISLPWILGDIQGAIFGLIGLVVSAPVAIGTHYILYWFCLACGIELSHP